MRFFFLAVRRKDFFSPPTYKDANSVGHENEMWFLLNFFGAAIGERPFLEWKDGFFFFACLLLGSLAVRQTEGILLSGIYLCK